ncbi:MAG: GFA family protein [Gammaproteobacteria bacterium]|nr:GFA family protein [Gammaproteobacteria bacterium]MDH3466797.1 GFA family protein [Gammaproteobacteria bacterium]
MQIDGGCRCGHITCRAEVDPPDIIICHCADCQKLPGTAFRTVVFAAEKDFAFLEALPKIYVKAAESGRQREQTSYPECGSPIYSAPVGVEPRTLDIRFGTANQREDLPPQSQFWSRSAQFWLGDIPSMKIVSRHV